MQHAAAHSPGSGAVSLRTLSRPGPAAALGVSSGEAAAMLMDGTARPLWGAWICPGAAQADQAERLRLLDHVLTRRAPAEAVVCGASAAWAWLGGPPPALATVRVRRIHRSLDASDPPLRAIEGLPPQRHISELHGVHLTSPLRTALELLGARPGCAEERARWIERLLHAAGAGESEGPPAEALEGFGPAAKARISEGWRLRPQAFR